METSTVTVQEIHSSFFTAGERALEEAKRLLNAKVDDNKSIRLSALGFTAAKPVKAVKDAATNSDLAKRTIEAIEYFTIHYPHYKFITNDDVKKLCEKYGLMEGGCEQYLGDIPEKNLRDIEAFKLRKEDYMEKQTFDSGLFRWFQPSYNFYLDEFGSFDPDRTMGIISNDSRRSGRNVSDHLFANYIAQSIPQITVPADAVKKDMEQPKFRICAPKSDFNTMGYEVRDGYKLVYDPIVLQPVVYNGIKGNLIITAWGDEASDEIVVNQTMN